MSKLLHNSTNCMVSLRKSFSLGIITEHYFCDIYYADLSHLSCCHEKSKHFKEIYGETYCVEFAYLKSREKYY